MRWLWVLIVLSVIASVAGSVRAQSQYIPDAIPNLDRAAKGTPPIDGNKTHKTSDEQTPPTPPPIVVQVIPPKADADAERARQEQEKQQLDIDRKAADAGDRAAVATGNLVTVTGVLVRATDRVADYTLYLVIGGAVSIVVLIGQFVMFWRQLAAMSKGIEHSKTVAETALAALDRPWLFLTRPRHNQAAWVSGEEGLDAVFSLTNYGKAPAIVLSVKGVLFPSPGPKTKVSEIGGALEEAGIIDFPSQTELRNFKAVRGIDPSGAAGRIRFFQGQVGPDRVTVQDETSAYTAPFVIGVGDATPSYRIAGRPKFVPPARAIAMEAVMNIYLIGTIFYHGPDGEVQMISFCYESQPRGEFKVFRGAPYNDLRKAVQ